MKILAIITAIMGFLAVALGAFGAHALRQIVAPEMLTVWQTAMQYQMFHVLALLSIVIAGSHKPNPLLKVSAWLFVVGILLFSGSLYLLVITGIKSLGMITPVGGAMFLIGWAVLAVALVRFVSVNKS